MKSMLAKIINNIPYCAKCNSVVGNGKDYRQVEKDGKQYTEFIKYCSNISCHETVVYHVELGMDEQNATGWRWIIRELITVAEELTNYANK